MARPAQRFFIGERLRELRRATGLNQGAMAARLGISVSYLSQLESGERPLTTPVAAALRRLHPEALAGIEGSVPARRLQALTEALADPATGLPALAADATIRLAEERPEIADRMIALHVAVRSAEERLRMVEEAIEAGSPGQGRRMPWEAVRDWFHGAGNYVDPLDRAAEALADELGEGESPTEAALTGWFAARGIVVEIASDESAPLHRFDRTRAVLTLGGALPVESRRFALAHRLAATAFADTIAEIADAAPLDSVRGRTLLRIGLANYAAGALLMPYARFRAAARTMRHDIDRLGRRFAVSFEQACHRLSTLQRPGAEGIPFYFCRVDMAGNITKRHSATRLQFARFGGACPLWQVHEAVAIPDRIVVQHAVTPDGVRYVSMAKGLVKPSGNFARPPRRYAVTLGCEAEHAAGFVYADAIDRAAPPTPIGISCRLCPRDDCDQRAFPPADRDILVDPDVRRIVPYRVA